MALGCDVGILRKEGLSMPDEKIYIYIKKNNNILIVYTYIIHYLKIKLVKWFLYEPDR